MPDITLPQLGETITEGTITEWFKQVGDAVSVNEPLFEVSTDKVDTEVPSPFSGVIAEIRVAEGDVVEVGAVVAVVGDGDPAASQQPAPVSAVPDLASAPEPPSAPTPPMPAPAPTPQPAPESTPASIPGGTASADRRLLSPVVRRLVNDHDLDLDDITATGAGGRITRDDVLRHVDVVSSSPRPAAIPGGQATRGPEPTDSSSSVTATTSAPTPAAATGANDTIIPLSKIRRLTGDHMIASKATSPHAFSVVEVDYAAVDVTRSAEKTGFKATEGFSLTYLPFIARAIIDGLTAFPHINASVSGDDLVLHGKVDLAVAVDLEHEGLVAPVLRNAENKRLRAIAREISDLAARARDRKLHPDDVGGGTFTISNNGSAGSVLSMPIINQPQVAIISTDAIVRKPVVVPTLGGDESIAIHPVGNLAMSWDHRAFDGAYAAGFLRRVKEILETREWNHEF